MTRRREAPQCPGQLALPIFGSTAFLVDAGSPQDVGVLVRPLERATGTALGTVRGERAAAGPTEAARAHTTAAPGALNRGGGTASPRATATDASLRGRIGALRLHATHDGRELTEAGRRAFLSRFEQEVDPLGVLDAAERERRAVYARREYFARLARASAQSRRRRA